LVKLDCHGDNESEDKQVGAAIPDAELESVEHIVGLEEITDPSLEPLLQEVSSKVNLKSETYFKRTLGFSKFLLECNHVYCLA
jgi:hypothetical protein